MTRGVAAHLNKYDGVNASGSVRGGATVEKLTSEMKKRPWCHTCCPTCGYEQHRLW